MVNKWKKRPKDSNWGEFGADDQLGRLNLITPNKVLEAIKEVKVGKVFSLSLPLNLPGGNVLNPARFPPKIVATTNGEKEMYLRSFKEDHNTTDVACDDMVSLCLQYSTHWDALAHIGSHFDADVDGVAEKVFYNGFRGDSDFQPSSLSSDGSSMAMKLGIENMARHGVQGRGVLVDLQKHFGNERRAISHNELMHVLEADGIQLHKGDMLCIHTGFADLVKQMQGKPDKHVLDNSCAVLDGHDSDLLRWVKESNIVAIIADNYAVEHRPYDFEGDGCSPLLPLHELCLFKLGVYLGELWYLTELTEWLNKHQRHSFLLTAPPLDLPGAVGSPLNPIATV